MGEEKKKEKKPKRKTPSPPHKRRSKVICPYCNGDGCDACRGTGKKIIQH